MGRRLLRVANAQRWDSLIQRTTKKQYNIDRFQQIHLLSFLSYLYPADLYGVFPVVGTVSRPLCVPKVLQSVLSLLLRVSQLSYCLCGRVATCGTHGAASCVEGE